MTDINLLEHQPIAWTPTPDVIERAELTKFMRQVGVSTWDELYQFSIRDVENFTEEVLKFLDIRFDPPYEKLLDTSDGIEFPKWFSRNADTPVRNERRNADTPVRNERRNADTPVRNEGEARTTPETFTNKKGWHERGYLRHFDGVTTQFVTFRLGDSLPQNVLKKLKDKLKNDNLSENSDEYREMVEHYLDQGMGSCMLKRPAIASIVRETIRQENGKSCELICWVIMPNHVHILLKPLQGHSLSDIVKRIKGVSARRINQHLGKQGQVWQPDYFDRYIRDAEHFAFTYNYILENPVKAGLAFSREDWEFSSISPQAAMADKSVRVPTAGLNITTMCLDRWIPERGHSCPQDLGNQPAVIWEGQTAGNNTDPLFPNLPPTTLSYSQLFGQVERCASGLRHHGLGHGDAIGIHLPMVPEAIIALLAIGRIGAIAVPVFSGYGVEAIASRFNAIKVKAVFTCDGFPRRDKFVFAGDVLQNVIDEVTTIEKVFVVQRYVGVDWPTIDVDDGVSFDFDQLLSHGSNEIENVGYAEPTSAEDPLIILYTSGTTGKPKGIAHTHASFPIKAAQDMAFGMDVGRGTRICWYTDLGWMMGPWLIYGALINGATICLYDGAPDYPTADRMWEFCARHKVEFLGISPTLVRSLAAQEERNADTPRTADTPVRMDASASGTDPAASGDTDKSVRVPYERHDLSSLRAFGSTGEPWNPAPWWWLFERVGNSKLPIINYSGGTEISGGILSGNFLLPIKPCSFPAPCPGMDVDIVDENGESVKAGEVGELVIRQPWIGMARGFWQEKERYLDTYWSRFKDTWVHGDWAMRDEDGHWFILGRSDDTLKVAGKRVGPAEVESILVSHPAVTEAAVIGVPDEAKGTAMVAFCVLRNADTPVRNEGEARTGLAAGGDADKSVRVPLQGELKALVAKDMGKPLAPSKIHFVSALPKTRNAKVMRRVLRSAYLGEDPGDLSSLENPQSVDEISSLKTEKS